MLKNAREKTEYGFYTEKVASTQQWMLNYYDEFHQRKTKRICGSDAATLAEIWQAAEAQQEKKIATFATLAAEFQQTHAWNKLSPLTKKDYLNCHHTIITRDTSTGKLGDVPLNKWTVGLIRKYRDKRAEESESRANKKLSYIKRLFAWAYEYEKVPINPGTGIKKSVLHRGSTTQKIAIIIICSISQKSPAIGTCLSLWSWPICAASECQRY